jgi:hypothetical protein
VTAEGRTRTPRPATTPGKAKTGRERWLGREPAPILGVCDDEILDAQCSLDEVEVALVLFVLVPVELSQVVRNEPERQE